MSKNHLEYAKQLAQEYKASKREFIFSLRGNLDNVPSTCATLLIPLVAAWYYVLEEFPEHRDLALKKIITLSEYYNY
jgi:hypothetical protein